LEVAECFGSGRRFVTCGESESGVVLVQVENLHPLLKTCTHFGSGRRFVTCGESESGVVLVQVENLHPLRTEWLPVLKWPNVLKVAAGL
jgi:hypothetical protein